jgi:hypothetical protein
MMLFDVILVRYSFSGLIQFKVETCCYCKYSASVSRYSYYSFDKLNRFVAARGVCLV